MKESLDFTVPIHQSKLASYASTKTGERFFRCQKCHCGVIFFENNLMDYRRAVAEKLHGSFKMAAPICLCGITTLLSVSNSQNNYLRVSARENRAEAGRRGSADLNQISVGCCSYQTSNHGNIYFLIDSTVFENRPAPQKSP